ncbi:hypothetical protein ACFO1B_01235 [Dactylosporangium siamense]|uniref:hypothetical protein n=1 Tax=Dactylosporangium siamense TaxID=685454 RepID=UPI0019421596|nr:hypothetical protein [Dactylosporangium siamense]
MTTAGLTVRLLDPGADPEPAGWDAVRCAAGLRANWAWPVMRAGVRSGADPLLLAVLSDADRPLGVYAASVVPLHHRAGRTGWPRIGYLHVQAPQSSALPGWWVAPSTVRERADLVRAFRRAARRALGPGVGGVLWRQLGEGDAAWLPRPRYARSTEPLAVLDAPESLDAWFAGLSKKRRGNERRTQRLVAQDPDLCVRGGAIGDVVSPAELAHLARLNFTKHSAGGFTKHSAGGFTKHSAGGFTKHSTGGVEPHSGPRSQLWQEAVAGRADVHAVAYRDNAGRLLGAATILEHPTWPLWLSWGALPVDEGGRRHLYFDLFRRLVERVVDRGATGMILGKGMAELKQGLGARLVPQQAAMTL